MVLYPLSYGGRARGYRPGVARAATAACGQLATVSHPPEIMVRIREDDSSESTVGHHTKDKGDIGVAKALADLVTKRYQVLLPLTEHAPFDLVAYRDGRFLRIQVKYRSMTESGVVEVTFESVWSDRHGLHKRPVDKTEIDLFCIYCPDTDLCYYLRPQDHAGSVKLRIVPSRNNQRTGVWRAADFLEVPEVGREFGDESPSL